MNTLMNEIHTADSLDKLDELDENSVHAIVTDPPYGLAFMGKSWDDFEPKEYQQWCEKWARKAKRVLKPGGHMLAFSGNRTHHRLFSGVEDAGYEVRDTITWHYGSGFPKALDVSKSIDKQNDAEREVVGSKADQPGYISEGQSPKSNTYQGGVDGSLNNSPEKAKITEPATAAAKKWDGFKTALKPATEYIVVARKPFDGTVAENVQKHGTGALNIDGTRIGTDGESLSYGSENGSSDSLAGDYTGAAKEQHTEGRYPSNVIFDETQAHALDEEVGELKTGELSDGHSGATLYKQNNDGSFSGEHTHRDYDASSGGPSRYFYTSKATKAERTLDGKIENAHPTVKPTDLMEWLVTLVTAENQIVLDPFIGSGTTGMACKNKNRQFIGIEKNKEYADIARVRCGLTPNDPSVVRSDDAQNGLSDFT